MGDIGDLLPFFVFFLFLLLDWILTFQLEGAASIIIHVLLLIPSLHNQ